MRSAPLVIGSRRRPFRASDNATRRDRSSPEREGQDEERREQDQIGQGSALIARQAACRIQANEQERAGPKAKPEREREMPKEREPEGDTCEGETERLEDRS